MGLWDKIKSQFIDVIEWDESTGSAMVWKFPRYDDAIKNGAQLIVRESQVAVFMFEGQIGDVFGPGRHKLTTNNIPILTTLANWKYGFNDPFKCDIYFCSMKVFTDRKWGTSNPIMLRDPEFGPLRLRAFGSFCVNIIKPEKFIRGIAGAGGSFDIAEIDEQLRNMVVTDFADALGESNIAALDLAANYKEMGSLIEAKLQPGFSGWGLQLSKYLIENISLPPAVEKALDEKAKMGILGDNMSKFQQMKAGEAIGDMANNQGSAGGMMGVFAGMNMGQSMGGMMSKDVQAQTPQAPQGSPAAPPPLPSASWFVAVNGQQRGPFDESGVKNLIVGGQVNKETLAWKEGMANWTQVGQVDGLASLFGATPPPLPPPMPPEMPK